MALPGSPREQVCPSVCQHDTPSPGGDGIEGLRRLRHAPLEETNVRAVGVGPWWCYDETVVTTAEQVVRLPLV